MKSAESISYYLCKIPLVPEFVAMMSEISKYEKMNYFGHFRST